MILSKVYEDAERRLERNEITLGEFEQLVDIEVIEPKCGEWIELGELDGGYWKCSACGTPTEAYSAFKIYAYCPFCGARMEDVKHLPHIKRLKGADDE